MSVVKMSAAPEGKCHACTQCNMYMLNRTKTTSRGITANLKPHTKNTASQTLKKFFSTPSTSTSAPSETESDQPDRVTGTRSVHVQFRPEVQLKCTQTPGLSCASRSTQYDITSVDISASCLEQALYVLRTVPEFWALSHEVKTDSSGSPLLVMSREDLLGTLYGKGIEPIRITLDMCSVCVVNRLFSPLIVLNLAKNDYALDIGKFMDTIRPLCSAKLVLCPGIKAEYVDVLHSTSVVSIQLPYSRHQAKKCALWYDKTTDGKCKTPMCLHCKYLTKNILQSRKRKHCETPGKKYNRRLISSNYGFTKLTPMSKTIRQNRLRAARCYAKQKISKLESIMKEKKMTLNEEQSCEMRNIVKVINRDHKKDLEGVLDSMSDEQRKKILVDVWDKDSEAKQKKDTKQFFKDQATCKTGKRSNKWSSVTYRMALAVYCRSPAAYNALSSFKILQLPSLRSLQGKTSKFLDNPGINHQYIQEQSIQYKKFRNEKKEKGETEPCGEGVLIFDEVKVIDKIMWNSKNHEFIGLAMTPNDFAYLNDIFIPDSEKPKSEPTAAKYMLQFVWRDLTSKFDIIGPYFSCLATLKHKFILGCLLETMRVFHAYGFRVKCLVCDGASENLALIKTTMSHKGVFGYKKHNSVYDFTIQPFFLNPFVPDYKCHWIICPSHQMKNMISALHSSRNMGQKQFIRNKCDMGWKQIKNMKFREDERFEHGQLRFVPGLLETYIVRDSWTRLNVKPSKIMQQEAVMSELYSYSQEEHPDSGSALETFKYLKACNKLFENGMLCKNKVENIQSEPVQSIVTGYKYFEEWIQEILAETPDFNPNSSKQKRFLAWQTWDLLRICVFGVQGLVEDFLENRPGYFLVLSRINGSVVESLFSQFKYSTGSKLSSANYAQARRNVIMKSNIQGSHPSNKDYRNVPLYVREQDL